MGPESGATAVEIAGIVACECPAHVRVVLVDTENERKLKVRVDVHAGQALLAELAGLTSASSAAIDLLRDTLVACGASADWVALRFEDNDLRARMCVRGPNGLTTFEVPATASLILARRATVPLYVEGTASRPRDRAAVPEVYRQVFESIDFGGLDG